MVCDPVRANSKSTAQPVALSTAPLKMLWPFLPGRRHTARYRALLLSPPNPFEGNTTSTFLTTNGRTWLATRLQSHGQFNRLEVFQGHNDGGH